MKLFPSKVFFGTAISSICAAVFSFGVVMSTGEVGWLALGLVFICLSRQVYEDGLVAQKEQQNAK